MSRPLPFLGSVTAALLAARLLCGCTGAKAKEPVTPPPATEPTNVMICAPGSFTSGAECIPVAEVLCPAGTVSRDGECVAAPSEKVADSTPEPAQAAAPAMRMEDLLDPRATHQKPRARALLVTELQALETMFVNAAKASPDRPRLARRLAEAYVELSAAAEGDELAAATARKPDEQTRAEKITRAARSAAIKYYTLLSSQYPNHCSGPASSNPSKSQGCDDEVLYYTSLEYLRAKQLDQARRTLLALIQKNPQSPLLPNAYFLFGEMFRDEAAGDPAKWPMAEQSYAEASKYPKAPIAPAALLRLGEVYEKQGNALKARATYLKLLAQYPTSDAASHVPAGGR